MTFGGEKEHHYREQLVHWFGSLEHQAEVGVQRAMDDLIFHNEHPAPGYARVVIDCHAGPHAEQPYHAQRDFHIIQSGIQQHMNNVYHQLGISIVTMEAAHAQDSNCPHVPRIDIMYAGHEMTITGG